MHRVDISRAWVGWDPQCQLRARLLREDWARRQLPVPLVGVASWGHREMLRRTAKGLPGRCGQSNRDHPDARRWKGGRGVETRPTTTAEHKEERGYRLGVQTTGPAGLSSGGVGYAPNSRRYWIWTDWTDQPRVSKFFPWPSVLGTLGLDKGCNINISQSHPCLAARGLDIILLAYQYGPRDCLLHQCEGKKTGEPRWVATYRTWGGPLQDLEGS